ncbi:hypothetical protein VQH23_07980 [Pararoseomonas sp. SCSIO 73927]|uniref:hypothetical protein n=1 Tax=Pararoseomonas sp. SCSIO 73927 TaxID=3114537 RepID=UPI0030D55875
MPTYRLYEVAEDGRRHPPLDFDSLDDTSAVDRARILIGETAKGELWESQRIVKLMRARPMPLRRSPGPEQ